MTNQTDNQVKPDARTESEAPVRLHGVVRPIWVNHPDCPTGCGRLLNPAMGPWKERGDWMCHGDHDGKRIWFDYELVMILRAKCERLEKTIRDWPNDQAET